MAPSPDIAPPHVAPIESPCNKICTIDPASRLCIGCFRSMAEVAQWSRFSPEQRTHIMQTLPAREDLIAPEARYR